MSAVFEVVLVPATRQVRSVITSKDTVTEVNMSSTVASQVISDLTAAMIDLFLQDTPVALKR